MKALLRSMKALLRASVATLSDVSVLQKPGVFALLLRLPPPPPPLVVLSFLALLVQKYKH
jgi:hypothetical protein